MIKQYTSILKYSMNAIASIWPNTIPIKYPHKSASEALRKDGKKITSDLIRILNANINQTKQTRLIKRPRTRKNFKCPK